MRRNHFFSYRRQGITPARVQQSGNEDCYAIKKGYDKQGGVMITAAQLRCIIVNVVHADLLRTSAGSEQENFLELMTALTNGRNARIRDFSPQVTQ